MGDRRSGQGVRAGSRLTPRWFARPARMIELSPLRVEADAGLPATAQVVLHARPVAGGQEIAVHVPEQPPQLPVVDSEPRFDLLGQEDAGKLAPLVLVGGGIANHLYVSTKPGQLQSDLGAKHRLLPGHRRLLANPIHEPPTSIRYTPLSEATLLPCAIDCSHRVQPHPTPRWDVRAGPYGEHTHSADHGRVGLRISILPNDRTQGVIS